MYLCDLCGSENKQRLFPYTALTDWFYNREGVCLLRGMDWVCKYSLLWHLAFEMLSRYTKCTFHCVLQTLFPNLTSNFPQKAVLSPWSQLLSSTAFSPNAQLPSLCCTLPAVHYPSLFFPLILAFKDRAMAQAVSRRPSTTLGLGFIPVLTVWDLHWATVFFPSISFFSLSLSFHQCCILIFVYMLLLPEGQMVEAWEPSIKQWCFGIGEQCIEKWCISKGPPECSVSAHVCAEVPVCPFVSWIFTLNTFCNRW